MDSVSQNVASGTLNSTCKVKEKLKKAGRWVWDHKKWITIAITTTAGVIILVRKRNAIKDFLQALAKNDFIVASFENTLEEKELPSIPSEVLAHRTGEMLTATKLGSKVGVSNREINRRLVNANLAIRLPCGEYKLTDTGELLGEISTKVTPWEKTVPLVQWDEAVLEIIFSPEELTDIAKRQQHIQEILNQASA